MGSRVFDGFRVEVRSDDHEPPHVHVIKSGEHIKIALGDSMTMPSILVNYSMGKKDARKAFDLVLEHQDVLLEDWSAFMDKGRRLSDAEFERQFAAATEAGRIANATEPRAVAIRYRPEDRKFALDLRNETTFVFPADKIEGLQGAPDAALAGGEVRADGESLYWPELDVACTVPRLVMGFFGSKAWMSELARRAGSRTSDAKKAAVRENGKKGGRPKKQAGSGT